MAYGFEDTRLWRTSLGASDTSNYAHRRESLAHAFHGFRERAALVANEIPLDLREFTVHDISHIDALWELADDIAGDAVRLTPTEAFVLGGAFLTHDLGMGLAAWPGGMADLMALPNWPDNLAAAIQEVEGRPAKPDEIATPSPRTLEIAKRIALRDNHAKHAVDVSTVSWQSPATGVVYHLIEDVELRERYGPLIGEIAASHWWNIEEVGRRFSASDPIGAPVNCPDEWTVDALKLACLLRVSDAAHLDARRAPGFLRAIRGQMSEVAEVHWTFQNYLERPRRNEDRLVYTSARPFNLDHARAWWACYSALEDVDLELKRVDSLLLNRHRPRFAARGVRGIEEPNYFAELVRTAGWEPVDARPRIGNVPALVRMLGGEGLYGPDSRVAFRELIQNARDATAAMSALAQENSRPITVELAVDSQGSWWLTVSDGGIGMSREVVSGTLLDFGQSYWGSQLMRVETPGLAAQPFSPVGHFGIGFYSVFMLGEEVRVTTRRYDEASSSTRVLEFNDGLNGRPILRPAAPNELRHNGGTSVSVKLKIDPMEDGGLLYESHRPNFTLFDLCGYMAPALDCDLDCKFQDTDRRRVVTANDWLSMDGAELIRRISGHSDHRIFPRASITLSDVGSRLMPLDELGVVLGRASLAPGPPVALDGERVVETPACVVIGGLRADSDLGGVTGIVVGEPTRADRLSFALSAEMDTWSKWATAQASIWETWVGEQVGQRHSEAEMLVGLVIRLDGEPAGLIVAESVAGFHNLQEVVDRAADQSEIVFANSFAVDVRRGDERTRYWSSDHVEFELGEKVLLGLSDTRYGSWDEFPERADDELFDEAEFESLDEGQRAHWFGLRRSRWSRLVMSAVATAWGMDMRDAVRAAILDTGDDEERRVEFGRDFAGRSLMSRNYMWRLRRPIDTDGVV